MLGVGSGSSETSSGSKILIVEERGVKPGLGEKSHGAKHAWEVASLGPGLSWTIHCHLDSFVVGGHLHGFGHDGDGYDADDADESGDGVSFLFRVGHRAA